MEIRTGTVFISPSKGYGPQERVAAPIVFPREVQNALVGITGYSAGFRGKDHHLGRLAVTARHQIVLNTVSVTVSLGLRDWSGEWDDEYTGIVNFVVLAELAAATDPPSRPDLIVTDAEITQVTQHFRSAAFLDPVNVRPDNSIPLLARKPTGVRLWINFQPDLALPPISAVTGQLEAVAGNGSVLLTPVEPIVPRRESQILRGEKSHTLNFVIPEDRCQGVVTIRARAISATDPTQRSALFERILRFVEVEPLRVHLVGVEDASVNPPRPAPTYADMRNLLGLAEQWYPYGEIADTGYETLTTTYNYVGNVATEDPAGWDDLLDDLSDLRGSAPEIYVAEVPSGTPTGDVGGVSNFSDAGAFSFGNRSSAGHEIGHCLGREHAPCNTCSPPPADADGNYPQYGAFPRDSIGEFGYDVFQNRVLDPANTFDFMGYSNPGWVSPYTYKGLSGTQSIFEGAGFALAGSTRIRETRGNRIVTPMEALYLQLEIHRDRSVTRRHSFHYPVAERVGGRHKTPFTAEIIDEKGKTLVCSPLYHSGPSGSEPCGCGSCWPVRVRDMIPFPKGSRKLVVWEDRTAIYEESIPASPQVRITGKAAVPDGILLKWEAKADPPAELWYIVQFEDHRGLVWRGVAPRTSKTELLLPQKRFAGRQIKVRVLASSGIATGTAAETVEFARPAQHPGPTIVLVGATSGNIPRILRAAALHPQRATGTLAWFDENGAELSQGPMLDTGRLSEGESVVRAVASGMGLLEQRSWLVTKKGGSVIAIREIVSPAPDEPHIHPHPKRQQ